MREILTDSTMQEALMALHDSNLPAEPPDGADALESVRRHSRAVGFNNALAGLLSLSSLAAAPVAEEETDYAATNANPP